MTDHDDVPTTAAEFPAPELAYAGAPGVIPEIGWLAEQARSTAIVREVGREYWLRKAALVDRIALARVVTHTQEEALETAEMASNAAVQLIEYDEQHRDGAERPTAGSIRFSEAVVGAGYRAYVRQQYLAWSHAQNS
jgi:hypothetical protein